MAIQKSEVDVLSQYFTPGNSQMQGVSPQSMLEVFNANVARAMPFLRVSEDVI